MPSTSHSKAFGQSANAGPEGSALALACLVLLAVPLVAVAPFFLRGTPAGHDIAFHISSWMDVTRQWRSGTWYPRWAELANYGFGEPRFIFYPPLSWMLGAGLGSILPWKVVPGTVVWIALSLAGISMFCLAREWMTAEDALRAAIVYAVNPYHMVVVYLRSDYAELLGSAIFPFVVLYVVRLAHDRTPAAKGERREIGLLAIAFAAVWLTNAPAAVIATYAVAVLLVVLSGAHRSLALLVKGAAAVSLGFLLAGFYVVPAAFEQGWVNISEILDPALQPDENFLFTFINDLEHNLFNLQVSTIGAALIIFVSAAAFLSLRSSRGPEKAPDFWPVAWVFWLVPTALMLPITSPAWRYLPKLRFVQFPWRWLFPLAMAFALLVVRAIRQTRAGAVLNVLVASSVLATGAYLVRHASWDSEETSRTEMAVYHGRGYEGTDEYHPRGADRYGLPRRAPRVAVFVPQDSGPPIEINSRARVEVARWEPERKLFTVETKEPAIAALRLLNYPAWQVEINGQRAEAKSHEDTGQMLIVLPSGRSSVGVRFVRTWDRTVGGILSILAAAVLFFAAGKKGRLPVEKFVDFAEEGS